MASVVDIFCGAGGLTHGFILEGFNVVAGVDYDESCRYAYEHNNKGAKFIQSKIEDIASEEVLSWYEPNNPKILVGCAPCQPFSSHTNKIQNKNDEWQLVGTFADLILEVQPDIVSMENVPRLQTFQKGSVFNEFIEKLKSANYHVFYKKVFCPDYGIPQKRERLVVLASKYGDISLIPPTHSKDNYPTISQAIQHLPSIEAGDYCESDLLHRASKLSDLNLKRIRASKPGGTWLDWDEELRTDCHRRDSGQTYKSVYGRMSWDEPSPTITTQAFRYGTGRFGHPEQDRGLSLREMALLQTFPDNYEFVDPEKSQYTYSKIGCHIGNAVPVTLAQVIAKSISKHLEEYNVKLSR